MEDLEANNISVIFIEVAGLEFKDNPLAQRVKTAFDNYFVENVAGISTPPKLVNPHGMDAYFAWTRTKLQQAITKGLIKKEELPKITIGYQKTIEVIADQLIKER